MRKKIIYLSFLLSLTACENAPFRMAEAQTAVSIATESSMVDSERVEQIQRKQQQLAIESAFARRTSQKRAERLAEICFEKTEGTVFKPFDLAEIALAETGGHGLSSRAVSSKGALGVWQLMPRRARSHGYSPKEMGDDAKCAEAAILELYSKLDMARGNMERAKKLYCGRGPQADAYMKKISQFRLEMITEFNRQTEKIAMADTMVRYP